MLAELWQRRSSDSKDHTLSILRTREDYDISGFDLAALDRAKFYLNHIHESNHICGVGGLLLSSIFVKGFLNRRRCLMGCQGAVLLSRFHTSKASWIFHGVACLMLSSNSTLYQRLSESSTVSLLLWTTSSGQITRGTNQKYLEKDYLMKDGEPAHELHCWRRGLILTPIEEWTRGRSYLPICCSWIAHSITKAKQTAAQDSVQTYQRIPTLVPCSPEISLLNRLLIRPDDLPYLPHNWNQHNCGELWNLGTIYSSFLFQASRNEKVSFPQRIYQRISVRPTFKEMVHAEIGSLLACREKASSDKSSTLSNSKIPILAFRKFVTKASQDNKLP